MKQKMVIKVEMKCKKCRVKTMEIVAATSGVKSLAVGGDGEITVIGEDVDLVSIVSTLRKKVGSATVLRVEEMKEQKRRRTTPSPSPYPSALPYDYSCPCYM
ncbi:LOW QUALITY PROTEIN: hypothetical protein V2J09_006360 [Rumex salicifolius]